MAAADFQCRPDAPRAARRRAKLGSALAAGCVGEASAAGASAVVVVAASGAGAGGCATGASVAASTSDGAGAAASVAASALASGASVGCVLVTAAWPSWAGGDTERARFGKEWGG